MREEKYDEKSFYGLHRSASCKQLGNAGVRAGGNAGRHTFFGE